MRSGAGSSSLAAVLCQGLVSACTAVGKAALATLAERWNGTSW